MLFLAVFCGFLAENQREHYIEHLREKQYVRSLLEDIQIDTATIKRIYNRAVIQSKRLDSLIELGSYASMNKENVTRLYMLHGQTTRFLNIRFEDGTSAQLKNAGGLRLIRNKKVVSSLRQYWNQIESFYRIRDRLEMAGEKIADVSSRVFYNKFFISADDPLEPPSGIKADATLISEDAKLMAEYINRVVSKSIRTKIYLAELSEAIRTTEELIILIKQQYHLK